MTILAPDFRQSGVAQGISELSSLSLHADQTFESFDPREHELDREKAENLKRAFSFARNFAAKPQDWIAFSGAYGCGKTHLAAAIANDKDKEVQEVRPTEETGETNEDAERKKREEEENEKNKEHKDKDKENKSPPLHQLDIKV